jgi:putative flippase GtrA
MGRIFGSSFLRFLIAGTVNTLATLAVYFLLLKVLAPALAWAVAFASGIVFLNVVYPRFVFRVAGTMFGVAGNTTYYLVSFLAGEALLAAATQWLQVGPHAAGFGVALAMVPVNFVAARYFFTRPSRARSTPSGSSNTP